jgi:hypothetical protein
MADPVTIGVSVAALAGMGTVLETVNSYQQAKAGEEASRYEAQQANQQAQQARLNSSYQQEAQAREARLRLARSRAAFAQSGVDPGAGSAAGIMRQSTIMADLDQLAIAYQGNVEAAGYQQEAQSARFRGQQYQRGAAMAIAQAPVNLASNALTGYTAYRQFGGEPVFGRQRRPATGGTGPFR